MLSRNVITESNAIFRVCGHSIVRKLRAPVTRSIASAARHPSSETSLITANNEAQTDLETGDFVIVDDFITQEEHDALVAEVTPRLRKHKYDTSHFDNVIRNYREHFHREWQSDICRQAIHRAEKEFASFIKDAPVLISKTADSTASMGTGMGMRLVTSPTEPASTSSMDSRVGNANVCVTSSPKSVASDDQDDLHPKKLIPVHALDLAADGLILPHVDNVEASGGGIAALSLMSTVIVRLEGQDERKGAALDVLVKPRSLYMQRGVFRYKYTHAVLGQSESFFNGAPVLRSRRISLMLRDALPPTK